MVGVNEGQSWGVVLFKTDKGGGLVCDGLGGSGLGLDWIGVCYGLGSSNKAWSVWFCRSLTQGPYV